MRQHQAMLFGHRACPRSGQSCSCGCVDASTGCSADAVNGRGRPLKCGRCGMRRVLHGEQAVTGSGWLRCLLRQCASELRGRAPPGHPARCDRILAFHGLSSWFTRWRDAPSNCASSSWASCRPMRISCRPTGWECHSCAPGAGCLANAPQGRVLRSSTSPTAAECGVHAGATWLRTARCAAARIFLKSALATQRMVVSRRGHRHRACAGPVEDGYVPNQMPGST